MRTNANKIVLKWLRALVLILITHNSVLSTARSAFKDNGWGVRPLGMGGAFTAVADDSNAPLYNPAGVPRVGRLEATFMSAKLFAGLEAVEVGQNFFSYIYPLGGAFGDMAVEWASLYTPELYREDAFSLSYGRYAVRTQRLEVSFGANVKYLKHEYTLDRRTASDPVFAGKTSAGAGSVDAGALLSWPEQGFSIGVAGKNLNTPDIGLKTEDKVPNENSIGFAYYCEKMKEPSLEYFTVALDVVSRAKTLDTRIGAETWFFDGAFAVRLGMQSTSVTAGLGYEFKTGGDTSLVIDYAFGWPLHIEDSIGTHRMGITLRLP